MATAEVNGVRLFYELQGTGAVPLVLVHGSWNSHHAWDLVVPRLAEAFRVLTYDRRGHSQSERPIGQGSVCGGRRRPRSLARARELVPAWVVANSSALRSRYGWPASILDFSGASLRTSPIVVAARQ